MLRIWGAVVATMLAAALLASPARAVTVDNLGIFGVQVTVTVAGYYGGPINAGIDKLVVDGVAMDGFCIDPWHPVLATSTGYEFRDLALAPKPPGPMGATEAAEIAKLWAMAYSPTMSNKQAAGLQIAIWEIVGGSNFSVIGKDCGASVLLANLQNYSGPSANLIALSGPGQDYVVLTPPSHFAENTPSTPDSGSTLLLSAMSFAAAILLRRAHKFSFALIQR